MKAIWCYKKEVLNLLEADQHSSYEVKHPNADLSASINSVDKEGHSLKMMKEESISNVNA